MAQDLNKKHWVAEISRVAAVYGTGHILSGKMDKDRDNGSLVTVGDYAENEYYNVSDFNGTGFEAKVIEVVNHPSGKMVRMELQKDCDAYFVHNPETMANDFLKVYQEIYNYYNAEGEVVRMYPMVKHDVFTVSFDAFHGATANVGDKVTWAQGTGYTAAPAPEAP